MKYKVTTYMGLGHILEEMNEDELTKYVSYLRDFNQVVRVSYYKNSPFVEINIHD